MQNIAYMSALDVKKKRQSILEKCSNGDDGTGFWERTVSIYIYIACQEKWKIYIFEQLSISFGLTV